MTTSKAALTRRQWAGLAAAGSVAAAAGAWWAHRGGGLAAVAQAATAPAGADPLPQPIQTLEGRTLANADLAGHPVVLNFWAPWCPPCVKEMPELDHFSRSPGARGAVVIGLAIDERPAVEQFLHAHPVGFPVAVLGYGGLSWVRRLSNGGNSALPFSVVFDRDHRIVQRKFGPTSEAELAAWIARL